MNKKIEIDIQPGSSILATYTNQSYKIENALAEFIDNSTQNFFDHRETLLNELDQKFCKIEIEIFPEYIEIKDNAFGMEIGDFRRALKLDSPPEDTSGRSEKGMGLKTSATNLGKIWSIETTRYGSNNKYRALVDVAYIKNNSPKSIEASVVDCNKDEHYTIIRIEALNKRINARTISSLNSILAQMYSKDIRNNDLILIINKKTLKYEPVELWINLETGTPFRQEFSHKFSLNGKEYSFDGWVGIRDTGNTEFSGLTLFRKGRAIKMNYRPTKLFGKPNLYPYQRIIGEIDLLGNNWEPSYTKDELMWEGELEDKFVNELKNITQDIVSISSRLRKTDKPIPEAAKKTMTANLAKNFENLDEKIEKRKEIIEGKEVDFNNIIETNIKEIEDNSDENIADTKQPIVVPYSGETYSFIITLINNKSSDFLKINRCSDSDDYELVINYGLSYFEEQISNRKGIEFIQKQAITIATTILHSQSLGIKEGSRILSIMNQLYF